MIGNWSKTNINSFNVYYIIFIMQFLTSFPPNLNCTVNDVYKFVVFRSKPGRISAEANASAVSGLLVLGF